MKHFIAPAQVMYVVEMTTKALFYGASRKCRGKVSNVGVSISTSRNGVSTCPDPVTWDFPPKKIRNLVNMSLDAKQSYGHYG